MQGPPFRVGRFLTLMLAIAALADPVYPSKHVCVWRAVDGEVRGANVIV